MTEQFSGQRSEGDIPSGTLDKVSTVVKLRRGPAVFVGWNTNGAPVATDDQNQLTQNATKNVQEYQKARLPIRNVAFSSIVPVNFRYVGQAVDYEDQGGVVAEDLLTYGIEDASGKTDTVSFGELSVLSAIVDSKDAWQETTSQFSGMPVSTANKIYTVFITDANRRDQATAILFKSSMNESSNETAFRIFLQQTLTNLLNIEKKQPREELRKGYLQALENYVKDKPRTSRVAQFLNFFVEVDENKVARITEGILGTFIAPKKKDPAIPNPYDSGINDLNLETLFDLAEAMRDSAYQALR